MARASVTTMLRLAALACVAALAPLSLLPAEDMVRTGIGGHIEHATAYAGTAFLMGISYRECGRKQIASFLIAYGGTLELLQRFSPGRHPGLDDWAASTIGVLIGTSAAYLALALYAKSKDSGGTA